MYRWKEGIAFDGRHMATQKIFCFSNQCFVWKFFKMLNFPSSWLSLLLGKISTVCNYHWGHLGWGEGWIHCWTPWWKISSPHRWVGGWEHCQNPWCFESEVVWCWVCHKWCRFQLDKVVYLIGPILLFELWLSSDPQVLFFHLKFFLKFFFQDCYSSPWRWWVWNGACTMQEGFKVFFFQIKYWII